MIVTVKFYWNTNLQKFYLQSYKTTTNKTDHSGPSAVNVLKDLPNHPRNWKNF